MPLSAGSGWITQAKQLILYAPPYRNTARLPDHSTLSSLPQFYPQCSSELLTKTCFCLIRKHVSWPSPLMRPLQPHRG
jgi:ATP-dependent helicase YprA (DUF1998 family)